MRQVPSVILALSFLVLTEDTRAQTFDCPPEDFVCPRLVFTNSTNQPVTSLPAGAELRVGALVNWSQPGLYTDVVVTVDGPDHFRLGSADSPGSYSTDCFNDSPTPQATWNVSCVFSHQGPFEPDVGTTTSLPLTFFAQRWSPADGYVGDFTITVSGNDPDGVPFTRSHIRSLTLSVAPDLRLPTTVNASGGAQVLFDHDNDPNTPRIKGRSFSRAISVTNQGSRTVTDVSLSWEIPSFVHLTGITLESVVSFYGPGNWTLAADNTATPGQPGGTLKARFDGARHWPLALSQLLVSPSSPSNSGTPSDTSAIVIQYVIACNDLPTSTAAGQPTTRRNATGTYLGAGGEALSTSTPDYDDPIWRWAYGGSSLAPLCTESWDRGNGAAKRKGTNDFPPMRYTASGMSSWFSLTLAPPDGVFELGPTTIRETLPPYTYLGHTSDISMTNPEFTTWYCRFDEALAPTMTASDFVLAEHPSCAAGGVPCHGSLHYYAHADANPLSPAHFNADPDAFILTRDLETGLWTSSTVGGPGQGCVLKADVCDPQFGGDTFGVRYGNANCTTRAFRAEEVTHIFFTTWDPDPLLPLDDESHGWQHPTDLNQRPETFSANVTLRSSPLDPPPNGLRAFSPEKVANVENRISVAGGLMQTTGCGLRDFAWFNRVCPPTGCMGCDDGTATPIERVAYHNIDNRARVAASARSIAGGSTDAAVNYSLNEVEAAWVGCRMTAISTPLLRNPTFTLTLPPGFRAREGGEAQRTGASGVLPFHNVPLLWKDVVPGVSDALLSGFLSPVSNQHNPTWQQVLDADVSWSIDGPSVRPDGRTTVTLTPSESELNWQVLGNDAYVMTMPLIMRVEPIPDFPFVHGQNYQGTCEVTARGPDDEVVSATRTFNLTVPMPAQMTVDGTGLCRSDSHHPTFDMIMLNTGGRNLVNAESIFLVPSSLEGVSVWFASATLDPDAELGAPPAFTLPLVEVSTAGDVVARVLAGTTNQAGVFVTYNPTIHDGAAVTAIRLRYPGTQFLPAYAQVRLRIALQLQELSSGLVGKELTTLAWYAAPASTLPYAESFAFDPFEVGQCPVLITAQKAFDEDRDGQPDASSTPLANWPMTLTVTTPSAANVPTDPQTVTTSADGLATFVAYPGQTIELAESLPTEGGGSTADWLQTFPSSGAPHTLTVGFEPPEDALLFLNGCQCEDDYACSAVEDRCELVAPNAAIPEQAVCRFGTPPGSEPTTTETPIGCDPDDVTALVTDAEGDVVGSIRCRVLAGAMTCDTNPDGTLTVHTDRLECN